MPELHKKYGGSTHARTLACPGWHAEAAKVPKVDRSSSDADRGSCLHDIAEAMINDDLNLDRFLGYNAKWDYTVNEHDLEQVQTALDAADDLMDKYGIEVIETEPFVSYDENTGGSIDLLGSGDEWVLVMDWKFGYVPVEAERNAQAAFYGWCGSVDESVSDMFEGKKLVVAIVQPAASDHASAWEVPEDWFEEFIVSSKHAIATSETGKGALTAGAHCKYCPAAAYCPAKREHVDYFQALDPAQTEQLAEGMAMIAEMKQQIDAIETEAYNVMRAGTALPGFKLVEKQARAKWIDEDAVRRKLRYSKRIQKADYIEEKLRSPAQVRKVAKKVDLDIEEFIEHKSSGLTVVPESDKREPAVTRGRLPGALGDMFAANE